MLKKRRSLLVNLRNFRVSFDREFGASIRPQTRTSHLPLEEFEAGTRLNIFRQFEGGSRTASLSANRELALRDLERGQAHALGRNNRCNLVKDLHWIQLGINCPLPLFPLIGGGLKPLYRWKFGSQLFAHPRELEFLPADIADQGRDCCQIDRRGGQE